MSASTTINGSVRQWKRYVACRQSGIPVLRSVPEHWNATKFKYGVKYQEGPGILAVDFEESGIPLLRVGNLVPTGVQLEGCNYLNTKTVEKKWSHFRLNKGDLLISCSATTGIASVVGDEAVGAIPYTGILRLSPTPKMTTADFVRYLVVSDAFVEQINLLKSGVGIQHYGPTHLGRVHACFPSLEEQRGIVRFLDPEMAKLDTLIAKKERLIELLQEKRIALISNAVTKGNDPKVKMKDSGVEWLGKIPAHWGVIQSRRVFHVRNEPAAESDEQLSASQKYGMLPQTEFMELEGRRVVVTIKGVDSLRHVESNDFVISLRSFQGGIEWCKIRGSVTFHYVVLKPVKTLYPAYFGYLFKSSVFIQALRATTDFIRDGQDLRYSQFVLVPLPVVPMDEQAAIASFLDSETNRLDRLIAKVREAIDKLHEYRTALISAAVTGKIDVREEVA